MATEKPKHVAALVLTSGSAQIVPDLQVEIVREIEGETYARKSLANASVLYYVAENDRGEGVGMDEVMRAFGMSVMQQGRLALSMKDSVHLGLVEQVAPRGEQFRWRITEAGLQTLGLERATVSAPPDPEELAQWMRDQHGRTNLTLIRAEVEAALEELEAEASRLGRRPLVQRRVLEP